MTISTLYYSKSIAYSLFALTVILVVIVGLAVDVGITQSDFEENASTDIPATQHVSVGILMTGSTLSNELASVYGTGDGRMSDWVAYGMDLHDKQKNPVALISANNKVVPLEIQYEFTTYETVNNEIPDGPEAHDLYVFSGSNYSVSDDLPWMLKLHEFIRSVDAMVENGTHTKPVPPKMLGICFGHQLIHKALGGQVISKARSAPGIGTHTYQIYKFDPIMLTHESFMPMKARNEVVLDVLHNDQVIAPAEGFEILAGNEFCPVGITKKADHILTFQPHPEYPNKKHRYVRSLLDYALSDKWITQEQHEGYNRLVDESTFPESARTAAWVAQFVADRRRKKEDELIGGKIPLRWSTSPVSWGYSLSTYVWQLMTTYLTTIRNELTLVRSGTSA